MQWRQDTHDAPFPLTLRWRGHSPGRINLIGEHTDYNGGKVLPFAMQKGMSFQLFTSEETTVFAETCFELVSRQQRGILRVMGREILELVPSLHFGDGGSDLRPLLPQDVARSWARYALGALAWHARLLSQKQLGSRPYSPAWVRVEVDADLPAGAGISSSAALCVGFLVILDRLHELGTALQELARCAMYVEHQFAGTRCGLMDQTAVALCEAHKLLMIDFKDLAQEGRVATRSVALHAQFDAYRPVLINTRVKHELGNSPYNERRRSCEEGLVELCRGLGKSYPSFGYVLNDDEFMATYCPDGTQASLKQQLCDKLFGGDRVRAQRVAHAIMEIRRVDIAAAALENGHRELLSQAIQASHESLRDDYQVSCRELDLIREEALRIAGELGRTQAIDLPILGARMTGGGFGGSTIQLVHTAILEEFLVRITDRISPYVKATGLVPEAIVAEFAEGVWVRSALA